MQHFSTSVYSNSISASISGVKSLFFIILYTDFLNDKKIKFWKVNALPLENTSAENGTVIKSDSKEGLFIKAKDGIIQVLEIQGENAKRMRIQDFLRGNELEEGKRFE